MMLSPCVRRHGWPPSMPAETVVALSGGQHETVFAAEIAVEKAGIIADAVIRGENRGVDVHARPYAARIASCRRSISAVGKRRPFLVAVLPLEDMQHVLGAGLDFVMSGDRFNWA
jgi:hypothetical protein